MVSPTKECRYCGLLMPRKPGELPSNYKIRVYHDRACAAADKRRINQEERSKQQPRQRSKINDPFAGFKEPLAMAPFSPPSAVVIQIPEHIREAVIRSVGIRNMRGALQ